MARLAVVLMNLGGPDKLAAVQPFLFNLFNDPAIINVPRFFRWPLAQLISRRRAPVAKSIYEQLGGASPLLEETNAQAAALEVKLGDNCRVFISMRYWHPRSHEAAKAVLDYNPDRIVLVPLYPQFSSTTTGSSVDDWKRAAKKVGLLKPTALVGCYPTNPDFIAAHSKLIRKKLGSSPKDSRTKVLFSAHGLPEKIISRGDPYQWQVEQTAAAIVRKLGYAWLEWEVCYQSRVGPLRWIGPSTEDAITRAGAQNQEVVVVPIAFVSEHSETLVELDMEYAALARRVGVANYKRVPTLGVSDDFISALSAMVKTASPLGLPPSVAAARMCPLSLSLCCKALESRSTSLTKVYCGGNNG